MIFHSPYPDKPIPTQTFSAFVLERAAEWGDKPALIDGPSGRTITYRQLVGAIRLVASSLSKRGFGKGDAFAIYSPNVPEYAIAFHAVASLGGIVTTVNPLYTPHELAQQLRDANAQYLLTVPPFLPQAREAAVQVGIKEIFVFGEAEGATSFASLLQSDGSLPAVEIDVANDVVVLPYSSGTTGLPKGVMLTHRNLNVNIVQTLDSLRNQAEMKHDDVIIGILPFFHIYGMIVVMSMALRVGATVVSMPRFDLEQFLKILQDYGVTFAPLAPPIVLALAKHPLVANYDLSRLRFIISGAAPLSAETERAVHERLGCYIAQGYGMTEASPVTHTRPVPEGMQKPGAIGVLVCNTEGQIVDVSTGEAVGESKEGEIWVRGPQVMKGYLNNEGATSATVDTDGWLHTGDIGYIDEGGYYYVVDRLKELIKYKGYQVAPAELEAVLVSHPAVADAAVIGVKDEEAGEAPKAFVVKRSDIEADELMAWVAERVAPYKRIRHLEFIQQVPKSASGKILRRVLVEQERAKSA
jgi:acyl-CoA synthetase (AMP-forming)/AMP-acid ligase II